MGVKRIPVGGPNAIEVLKQRNWSFPLLPYFYHEPIAATRGLRNATCTGIAQYKAWGRALYLSTSASANKVFELAEASLIAIPPNFTIFDSDFYFAMTMNRGNNPSTPTGECLQGIGIGSMNTSTPWIGQNASSGMGTVINVQYNHTRQIWELFAASEDDPGVVVDLGIQPAFEIDLRLVDIAMEWLRSTQTLNVYANGELVHSQDMSKLLPSGVYGGVGVPETKLFITNGSSITFGHSEAGFYSPRFYQEIPFQPVT